MILRWVSLETLQTEQAYGGHRISRCVCQTGAKRHVGILPWQFDGKSTLLSTLVFSWQLTASQDYGKYGFI
jgi:ABC-type phosphate/phosphonate transport system ATPase subunit